VVARAPSPKISAYRSVVRVMICSFCSAVRAPAGTLKFAKGMVFSFLVLVGPAGMRQPCVPGARLARAEPTQGLSSPGSDAVERRR